MMNTPTFTGFNDEQDEPLQASAAFLGGLLPAIDSLDELKLTLLVYAAIARQEGDNRYVREDELLNSASINVVFAEKKNRQELIALLQQAIERGSLIAVPNPAVKNRRCLFLNDPRGRASAAQLARHQWAPSESDHLPFDTLRSPGKNSYQLYEENIAPLTPLIAEDIRSAEEEYSLSWVADAIHLAAQSNARSWRYIEAILRRWKKEGKHAHCRRGSATTGSDHPKGQFDEFIQR